MFLLNELQGKPGEDQEVLEVPGDDASALELITYNLKRLRSEYLGDGAQRETNVKLLKNGAFFLTAVVLMNQYGHTLAI